MKYSETVKNHLFSIIKEMDSYRWLFTTNPRFDFTRTKKWSFEETLKFMVCSEGNSLKDELLKYFEYSSNTPTNSSFNQRRAQILPEAFHYLFHEFTSFCESKENLYNGYRLLAIDGSDICIARNPNDERTYFQNSPETKGFNQVHVNASYDLLSRIYTDIIIQPAREENEKEAMCNIIDRYKKTIKTIFIADRGYEAYNILAHAEAKGQYYLIRVKDIHSTGILSGLHTLPQEESFDTEVSFILTNKKTKEVKSDPKYRLVYSGMKFDYLDQNNHFYEMKFRVLRFPISETSHECIITNLPETEFSQEEIKKLYKLRWGIETSFRELKYAIGLTRFHSRKYQYIEQEIWLKCLLYNFCETITTSVVVKQNKKKKCKHVYQLNYTRAIRICCHFISIKTEKAPPDIEYLISHELLPIRPGRTNPRKVKHQSVVSFLYRVA